MSAFSRTRNRNARASGIKSTTITQYSAIGRCWLFVNGWWRHGVWAERWRRARVYCVLTGEVATCDPEHDQAKVAASRCCRPSCLQEIKSSWRVRNGAACASFWSLKKHFMVSQLRRCFRVNVYTVGAMRSVDLLINRPTLTSHFFVGVIYYACCTYSLWRSWIHHEFRRWSSLISVNRIDCVII